MFKEYPDILTPEDAARALRISKASVYKLVRQKVIGCRHIGRKIIIPKQSLIDFARSARYTVVDP